MSEPNVERVRAYLEDFDLEALSRGEVDCPFLAGDVTYADEILPDHVGELYHGREGIGRAGRAWLEPFGNRGLELERVVGMGDFVVSVHRFCATARHTGLPFDVPLAWLFEFRDDEVVHWHAFPSEDEALDAARTAGSDQ